METQALTPEELSRYSRHIILPDIEQAGQQKLKSARILLIGLGGLGSPAALYLAAAGVGTIGLCDFDKVEKHNLQRQIIHDSAGEGRSKIESAKEKIQALNPHVVVNEHPEGINVDNALELLSGYDLVVDGSDNFPTRYLVNDACYFAKKPLIYGSIFQFEGQVSVFDAQQGGPTYRCLFPKMPEPGTVPNCAEAGVFGALCGVVGSFQAMEAIKLITGAGEPLLGRLLVIDALSMRIRSINLKPDPESPLSGDNPSITELAKANYEWTCKTEMTKESELPLEINVREAQQLLTTDAPPILLDVREPFEVQIGVVQSAQTIPMGEIGERYMHLPKDQQILVMCHHGMRSMRVTEFLRDKGYKAINVSGGIDAWSANIDPSIRRY